MHSPLDLLDTLFKPKEGGFSEELSRFVLSIEFNDEQKARYMELAAKSNEGTLTKDEREELELFVVVNDLLMILQSKARLSLRRQPAA